HRIISVARSVPPGASRSAETFVGGIGKAGVVETGSVAKLFFQVRDQLAHWLAKRRIADHHCHFSISEGRAKTPASLLLSLVFVRQEHGDNPLALITRTAYGFQSHAHW